MTRSKPTMSSSTAEKLDVAEADAATDVQAEARTGSLSRRSFIAAGVAAGAVATVAPLEHAVTAVAATRHAKRHGNLHSGDAAILRFLSAAAIIEADLWQQYNELGGIQDGELPHGTGSPAYIRALRKLDADMPQYIHDNTEDEFTHFKFINAYLESRGGEAVNLDKFRTLPSSKASGAEQTGRITSLMELT